jgi:hypothetical protein
MATVRHNIVIEGLGGMLGDQLILKRDKAGRTIISIKPRFDENREFTTAQLEQQERFQEATAYAKEAAQAEAIYAEKAEGTAKSAYNVAVADWFHSPEVREIDLSSYTGEVGETIRAKVVDDVQVTQVNILSTTGADVLVEQGAMTHEQGWWYSYTTTQNCPAGTAKVIVTGMDLPGHVGAKEATLTAV